MESENEIKESAKEKAGNWFGFIITISLFLYFFINSSVCLFKLAVVQANKGKTIVDYVKAKHTASKRTDTEYVNFRFTVGEAQYEITHPDAWWDSSSAIGQGEKFEVSYWVIDPSLCIPSKYILRTFFWKTVILLFSVFLMFCAWAFRPWQKINPKKS